MSCKKTIFSLAAVAAVGVFLFLWFGIFNVTATKKHWGVTVAVLEFALDRSVSVRAKGISVPDLSDPARVKRGAANYSAMCEQCHLAPGKETSELHQGMYPQPPVLYKETYFASTPAETFWVIKNGIKMTGMPAWGENNSDEQIWDMIALISELKDLTPEQYKKLVDSGKHTHKGDAHGKEGSSMMQKDGHDADSGGDEAAHLESENDPAQKESGSHDDSGEDHGH